MSSKWISVEEKLPRQEYDEYYGFDFSIPCIVFNGSIVIKETCVYSYRYRGWCLHNLSEGYEPEDFLDYGLGTVTHWQPLPEPPKQVHK